MTERHTRGGPAGAGWLGMEDGLPHPRTAEELALRVELREIKRGQQ